MQLKDLAHFVFLSNREVFSHFENIYNVIVTNCYTLHNTINPVKYNSGIMCGDL